MGYPPAFRQVSLTVCWYPFILLGGERHCESKVSCFRTQHNLPGQGSNSDLSNRDIQPTLSGKRSCIPTVHIFMLQIANWQFCASAVARTDSGKTQALKQCRRKRDKYKPGKGKLNEAVLELQFNVTNFSADNDTDAIINCFSRKTKKKKTFAPTCQFGDIYRCTYSEIVSILKLVS